MSRLKHNLINTTLILGVSGVAQVLTTIILAKVLTKEDMGVVKFIFSIAPFFASLCVLGQNNAITRFFGKHDIRDYNWSKWIGFSFLFGQLLSMIGMFIVCVFYDLTLPHIILSLFIIAGSLCVNLYSALFRGANMVKRAIIFQQIPFMLFFICVLAAYLVQWNSATQAILGFTVSKIISAVIVFYMTYKIFTSGKLSIPREALTDGLYLYGSSISMVILTTADKFFIAKMLTFEDLAIYSVTFAFVKLYEMVAAPLWHVLMPHLAKEKVNIPKLTAGLSVILAFLAVFYLVFGEKVLHLMFSGKYDAGAPLIIYFVLIGSLRVLFQIPSSFISGSLGREALVDNVKATTLVLVLNVVLNYFFILWYGLTGVVMATSLCWALRLGSGYWIVWRRKEVAV